MELYLALFMFISLFYIYRCAASSSNYNLNTWQQCNTGEKNYDDATASWWSSDTYWTQVEHEISCFDSICYDKNVRCWSSSVYWHTWQTWREW